MHGRLVLAALAALTLALSGCSGGKGGDGGHGSFTLAIADSLAAGAMELKGAYLRGPDGWAEALGNGTRFAFDGAGGNETAAGEVPAGAYDRLRLLFASVQLDGKAAALTQSGVEVAVNVTVPKGSATTVALAFAWPESFYKSAQGTAFRPVLSRLVVSQDGAETLRLEASDISTGAGKAPVARMRVFDPTGLEVFASTFVAESPAKPVVGNAGNITLSATNSEVLQHGATMKSQAWDVDGVVLKGNTVVYAAPISGGNHTIRLTVTDSEGNEDSQVVKVALKPGTQSRTTTFTGIATGAGGTQGVQQHTLAVDTKSFENASARLSHARLVLTPGSATLPVSDLDVTLDDANGTRIGSQTGSGSQHVIDVDVPETAASGDWLVRVVPDPAYEAGYTVQLTLTWRGVNPGIEAFLSSYEDGHSHTH